MIQEDYVTYEQAVKLKELGFDRECLYYYLHDNLCANTQEFIDEEICVNTDDFLLSHNIEYPCICIYSASTLSQAAKWLRDKGLFIYIWLGASGYGWEICKCGKYPNYNGTFITKFNEEDGDFEDSGMFTTYEKALSNAIDKALEILKQE